MRVVRMGLWSGRVALALALSLWLCPERAAAQGNPLQIIENLNRDAMEAYNALDINKAQGLLEQALQVAMQANVVGPLLARTQLNLGVVYIGGLGNQDAGLNSFVQAVCIDPNSQLDPLTSTPEVQRAFAAAIDRARAGACGGPPPGPGPGPGAGPGPGGMGPIQPPPPPPPEQALGHVSPPEQLAQTPLPLYVEISPLAPAREIFLFYRGLGMEKYKRVPMYQYQNGFVYQISCNDVWEPKVSYYIEAHGEDDQVVGVIASPAQPIEVPVVAKRTQAAPALPGGVPPDTCVVKECPPGMQGCEQPSNFAIGDSCSADAECQSGLECRGGDECMIIGSGTTEVPQCDPATGICEQPDEVEEEDPRDFKPTFLQAGLVVGMAYLQAGMVADRPPPENLVFVDDIGEFILDPYVATSMGRMLVFPEPGMHDNRLTAWLPDGDSQDSLSPTNGPLGGNCSGDGIVTGPMQYDPMTGTGLLPSRYCVRVKNPGFVPNFALRAAVGHFITPEIGLSAIMRFQFSSGNGALASVLLGARGEYMLTPIRSQGLMLSAFAGATLGQIQAKPPATGDTEGSPFAKSGLAGAHIGGNVRYRINPNFGVYASPEIDVQFPSFMLNIDLTLAGVEAAF
jgi:hypothetical protein